jgi:uncharacterized membrane protein YdjX (TVP38/TMEM64 family)
LNLKSGEEFLLQKKHSSERAEESEANVERAISRPGTSFSIWLRLLVFVAIVALGIFLYQMGFFQLYFKKARILEFLESLGPWSFLGFVLLQAAQVVLAPVPGELTGLMGGYLFGLPMGVLLSTTGLILGSWIAFIIARIFGQPLVERFVSPRILNRFDYLLHHKGIFIVFLLFVLPGFPKDYLCFIIGLGHLSILEFLVISSIGRLFGTVLLTLGGGYIRCEQYDRLLIVVGVAILIAVLMFVFRVKIERFLKTLHVQKS